MLFGGDGTQCFTRETSRDYKIKNHPFFEENYPPNKIQHTGTWAQQSKAQSIYGIIVLPHHWFIQLTNKIFKISFCKLLVYMIFSVSNNGIEWYLDFGPDSVTLTGKDLVQELTQSFQGNRLAAWKLFWSQSQEFLNNYPARVRVPVNPS